VGSSTAEQLEAVITVGDLGEFGLIAAIQALLPPDERLEVGPGDDAAVLRVPDGRVVATTDLLVEGRHFRRDWSGPADVGVKAAAQNLADVAAMGAAPRTLLVGLACPADLPADWVLQMIGGMLAECERAGASIAGGDVTAADCVMLGITALGELDGRSPVTRSGARPGDQVAIAGRTGWSAAGLALLTAGLADTLSPELAELVAAHRRPQPPYPAGPAAALAGATAMVDVSDGLLQDLGHVAAASGVRINVRAARIPVGAPVNAAAEILGAQCQDWVLAGGEDHALAATFPAEAVLPAGWTAIGEVRAGSGVLVDGVPRSGPAGWNHFSEPGSYQHN
jgi:thiamine-monophosphate kinase